jgi:hypothetical protein
MTQKKPLKSIAYEHLKQEKTRKNKKKEKNLWIKPKKMAKKNKKRTKQKLEKRLTGK